MINKPSKNHYIYIIKSIIKFIKSLWFLLILLITKGFEFHAVLGFLAIIVVGAVFIVLDWSRTKFYIKDQLLVFEKGVISKSKEEIPFSKINTVDFAQSILDRMFGTSTLKIDTGSVVAAKSEFEISLKYDIAERLKQIVLDSNNINSNEKEHDTENLEMNASQDTNLDDQVVSQRVITKKEIFKYALTKSKLFWAIGGFCAAFNFVDDIEKFLDIEFSKSIDKYFDLNLVKSTSIITIVLYALVFSIFIYVLIVIASIIFETIRLNDFTVKLYSNKISISYGLFSKKQYSFQLDKVYGIKYKQSILQQLFSIAAVELIAIGYGDEKDEKAILYPIVDNKFRDEFMKKVLPNMVFEGEIIKPPKSSVRRFILKRTLIWAVILGLIYKFLSIVPNDIKLAVSIFIIIISIISGYLNYRNTHVGINKNVLTSCGGSFNRVTTIIRQDTIQSITKKQSIFQRIGKVCTYKIDLYSSKLSDVIIAKHMHESLYSEIQQRLTF